MIAIDGTFRKVEEYDGPGLIKHCKKIFPDICIIADISTNLEALASIENGADGISTTLRGYTPETSWQMKEPIDIGFINELCQSYPDFPVIAEGKIRTPHQVNQISKIGVWSIVVGTAITRPYLITKEFVASM
jgi:N-acylglucosamine-6-phosphate 2-epimerase